MNWLRKERDLLALFAVWGLLLQSLVNPFVSTAHAAAAITGLDGTGIICSTRVSSAVPAGTFESEQEQRSNEKQSRNGSDCQCCHINCRSSCGGLCGGLLPSFASLVWPPFIRQQVRAEAGRTDFVALARLTLDGARSPPLRSEPS